MASASALVSMDSGSRRIAMLPLSQTGSASAGIGGHRRTDVVALRKVTTQAAQYGAALGSLAYLVCFPVQVCVAHGRPTNPDSGASIFPCR